MKIVHITKLPDGGASWCAMRICRALRQQGEDASMLLMQGQAGEHITIAEPDWLYRERTTLLARVGMKVLRTLLRPGFERLIAQRKRAAQEDANVFFTSPVTGYRGLAHHTLVREADIVHLHWVSDFVDFPSFFQEVRKPIVWTVHDENPGLGGFHYLSHREGASPRWLALDRIYADIKRKAMHGTHRPHLVAISSQMRQFFEGNEILKDCPVSLIHNGVDGQMFHPLPQAECRRQLGIPEGKLVFLFSSYRIEDKRKGLHVLLPALDALDDDGIVLVCLGRYDGIPKAKHVEVRCAGLVQGGEALSQYYAAADYFVLSSFQEAFAQTPLEAMACGTPVVSFPCSGAHDLIKNGNGVVASDFTQASLHAAIRKALSRSYDRTAIRKDVMARFSYDIIAQKYIGLYKQLLNENA